MGSGRQPSIWAGIFCLLLAASACAQRPGAKSVDLRIYVRYAETSKPIPRVRVELIDANTGVPAQSNYTSEEGTLELRQIEPGYYRIRVSDLGLETTTSDAFDLNASGSQTIHVPRRKGAPVVANPAVIAATDLQVPPKARKEFEQAQRALEAGDVGRAQAHFRKAIELYPQYAHAWNDLGITYMQTGDHERGREAFEKAIAADDKYAEALLNLAKVRASENKNPEAEALLQRALATSPNNPETLTVLANILLMENKLEEAASTAAKVHSLEHSRFAIAHWIAGRALELQHKDADAIAEYTTYLSESPDGAMAEQAKASLESLREH